MGRLAAWQAQGREELICYAAPGEPGSLVTFKPRYDNFIRGEWTAPVKGQYFVGSGDVLLGEIEGCPFYIGAAQFQYWRHTHLTVDVVPGRGTGFSLEAPEGVRFLTRFRLLADLEAGELECGSGMASG